MKNETTVEIKECATLKRLYSFYMNRNKAQGITENISMKEFKESSAYIYMTTSDLFAAHNLNRLWKEINEYLDINKKYGQYIKKDKSLTDRVVRDAIFKNFKITGKDVVLFLKWWHSNPNVISDLKSKDLLSYSDEAINRKSGTIWLIDLILATQKFGKFTTRFIEYFFRLNGDSRLFKQDKALFRNMVYNTPCSWVSAAYYNRVRKFIVNLTIISENASQAKFVFLKKWQRRAIVEAPEKLHEIMSKTPELCNPYNGEFYLKSREDKKKVDKNHTISSTSKSEDNIKYFRNISIIIKRKEDRLERHKAWVDTFGRKPKHGLLYCAPAIADIPNLKNSFKYIQRELRQHPMEDNYKTNLHKMMGIVNLIAKFGDRYAEIVNRFGKKEKVKTNGERVIRQMVGKELHQVWHDLGVNLNKPMTEEQIDFVYRNATTMDKWNRAIVAAYSEEFNKDLTLEQIELEMLKKTYDGVDEGYTQFAVECAKWGISQHSFEQYQKRFIKANNSIKTSQFPFIKFEHSGFEFEIIQKEDPRGIFMGLYTDCCQHPDGVGKSCAWYGLESDNSSFFVISKRGKVVAQSWMWKNENGGVCFDNVEMLKGFRNNKAEVNSIVEGYRIVADKLLSSPFNINTITIGDSHSDIELKSYFKRTEGNEFLELEKYDGYSDADEKQYIIAKKDTEFALKYLEENPKKHNFIYNHIRLKDTNTNNDKLLRIAFALNSGMDLNEKDIKIYEELKTKLDITKYLTKEAKEKLK